MKKCVEEGDQMNLDDQNSCSKCGSSPAANYICYGGTGRSAHLCDHCLSEEKSVTSIFVAEAKSAICGYCGGSPCCGGPDTLSQILDQEMQNRWMCMSCFMEYQSLLLKKLGGVPEGLSHVEQRDFFKTARIELDGYMKGWVRQRDN